MLRLIFLILLLVTTSKSDKEDVLFLYSLLKAVNIKIHRYEMNSIEISAIENQIIQLFCPGNFSEGHLIWSFNGNILSKSNSNWRKSIMKNSIFLLSAQMDLDGGIYECYNNTTLIGQVNLEIESSVHAIFSGLLYFLVLSGISGFIYFLFFLKMSEIRSCRNFLDNVMYG